MKWYQSMAGYSGGFHGLSAIDASSTMDAREKMLRKLGDILHGHDRQDMTLTMNKLASEFYRNAALAEDDIHSNKIGDAEGHRLIAEAIHHTLKTLEVKRRTIVKVIPPAAAAAAMTATTTTVVANSGVKEEKENEV